MVREIRTGEPIDSVAGFQTLGLTQSLRSVELAREAFAGAGSEGPLQKLARLTAVAATEPLSFDVGLAGGGDGDLEGGHQAPSPTCTVSWIEPSDRERSVTLWPWRRASSLAFSTA